MFRKDGVDYTNDEETAKTFGFEKFHYFSKSLAEITYKNHLFCSNQNDLLVLLNAWNRNSHWKYWV